jgi:hypothetical protein
MLIDISKANSCKTEVESNTQRLAEIDFSKLAGFSTSSVKFDEQELLDELSKNTNPYVNYKGDLLIYEYSDDYMSVGSGCRAAPTIQCVYDLVNNEVKEFVGFVTEVCRPSN